MSDPFPLSDAEIIDEPPPRRRRWRRWLLIAAVLLFILISRSLSIYVSALWFGSVGYSPVYWYILKLKVAIFLIFLILTAVILRAGFSVLERIFAAHALTPRTIIVNNQPVQFAPARYLGPLAWGIALIFALFAGLSMKGKWLEFASYLNRTQTSLSDPIFRKPLEFYLFSLPVLDAISSWLVTITFVLFCAALILLTAITATDDRKECALAFVCDELRRDFRRFGSFSSCVSVDAFISRAFLTFGAIIKRLRALPTPKPTTCFRR